MQKVFIAFIILVLINSCNTSKQSTDPNNRLSSEQKSDGWKLLFNGTSTKGWHRYGGGVIDSAWTVKDGARCLDPAIKKANNVKGDWDIVTNEEYDNFD